MICSYKMHALIKKKKKRFLEQSGDVNGRVF